MTTRNGTALACTKVQVDAQLYLIRNPGRYGSYTLPWRTARNESTIFSLSSFNISVRNDEKL